MLVLSRTVGKVIFIGDDISVHVLALNGSQVKFGVAAPAGVHVHRAEVCQNTPEHQAAELDATPDP